MTGPDSGETSDDIDRDYPQPREIAHRRAEEIANEGQIVKGDPSVPGQFYGPVNYFAEYTGPTPPAARSAPCMTSIGSTRTLCSTWLSVSRTIGTTWTTWTAAGRSS